MIKMRKILFTTLIMLLALSTGLMAQTTATAPDGSGTSEVPYLISNLAELSYLCQNLSGTNYWASGVYIKQTADINASSTQYWDDADDNDDGDKYNDPNDATSTGNNEGFSPIGNTSTPFYGNYNGQDNTIDGLCINRSSTNNIGFFGSGNGCTVQNLGVTSANINGAINVGTLLGALVNNSTANNCYTTGSVASAGDNTGGLVGFSYTSSISNSYSTANLNLTNAGSDENHGGLVGCNEGFSAGASATITNCYSSGNVSNGGYYVGGLVGYNTAYAHISNCYSNSTVTGYNYVGGLVGYSYSWSCTITNCYSTGDVTRLSTFWSHTRNGGFIGYSAANTTISNCYSTGSVHFTGVDDPTDKGFIGYNDGSYSNNFFDSGVSNQSTATGATAKTTAQMKTQSTFTDAGWDFEIETTNGTNDYWDIDGTNSINNGYPYLSWQDGEDVSLPVELTSFTADNSRAGEITLNWVTESEIENLGFILERRAESEDGTTAEWTEIASYITDESLRGQGSVTYQTVYTYTDKSVEPGVTYDYRLADVSYAGEKVYHALNVLGVAVTEIPEEFALFPAYPNPFNPETVIRYQLSSDSDVSLQIYDLKGQMIETLLNKTQDPGFYKVNWKPINLPSGVYFCKLVQGSHVSTQKLILLK